MGVAYVNSSTVAIGTRSNTSFTKPTGAASGQLCLILTSAGNSSAVAVTPPSGFTNPDGGTSSPLLSISKSDPWTTRLFRFYRFLDGSEGASFATTHTSGSTDGICYLFSGVDTSAPFTPAAATGSGTGTGGGVTITYPSLTGVPANSAVIVSGIAWDGWTSTVAPGGTTPTFTEYFDGGTTGNSYSAAGIWAAGGTTGTKTNTTTLLSGNPYQSATIALQPVASATLDDEAGLTFAALAWKHRLPGADLGVRCQWKKKDRIYVPEYRL